MVKYILIVILGLTIGQSKSTAQSLKEKVVFKVNKKKNKIAINSSHEANIGKIVFSNKRVPFKNEDESIFITHTNIDKPLFLRQYWDMTMEDAYKESFKGKAWKNAAILYEIHIDGRRVDDFIDHSNTGKENAITWYTTWADISVPRSGDKRGHIYSNLLEDCLGKNKTALSGNNEISLTSYIYNTNSGKKGGKLASGSIIISFQGQDLSSILSSESSKTPSCMHKPLMDDISLANELLDATKAKGWKEDHIIAVINTRDFTILRHPISGVIEGRTIGASVAANNDEDCFFQRFTYHQNHTGTDFSGNWRLQSVGGKETIPCSCLDE